MRREWRSLRKRSKRWVFFVLKRRLVLRENRSGSPGIGDQGISKLGRTVVRSLAVNNAHDCDQYFGHPR